MEYVNLGRSGLKVSRFSYGNGVIPIKDDEEAAQNFANNQIKAAWEQGINHFDTAEMYGFGKEEQRTGIALKALGVPRSDYVVSTKIFFGKFKDNTHAYNSVGTSRKRIQEGLDRSLKNLDLDYVDVLFLHRYDEDTPTVEVCRAMKDVIASGKALYWATSTWPAIRVMEALLLCDAVGCPRPIAEQCQYSMLNRDEVERDYVALLKDYGLGTTVYSPLACGVLTGKYNEGIPEGSRFDKVKGYRFVYDHFFGEENNKETVEKLTALGEIAKRIGCTQPQLALAWILKFRDISTAIFCASSEKQIKENVESLKFVEKLTPEILEEIEGILKNRPDRGVDYRNNNVPLPFRR